MRKKRNRELLDEMMQARIVPTVTKHPECILEAMELISESANNSHLNDAFFKAVEIPTDYLSERLQLTPVQSVLFSLLMDYSEDSCIHLNDLAEFTGCSTTRMLRFSQSLEGLAERFYIKIRKGRSYDSYHIPREVIMSLRDDVPYVHTTKEISDVNEFFDQYNCILKERRLKEITHEMLIKLNENNLEQIKDTHFAKTLYRLLWNTADRLLFIHMAYLYLSLMDDYIELDQFCELYDDQELPTDTKRSFRSRTTQMQEQQLIENSNHDGIALPDSFRLTDFAKKDVLKEVSINESRQTSQQLTKHDSFTEKVLVYNEREEEQIRDLTSILIPDRFKEIQEKLEKAGMRKGFCCLFHGAPGTGKTETVYQIARHTGRDILQINVDEIKSCWVGESEKNIANVFERYHNICMENNLAPILLFNEADAILGLRMEGAVRGIEKMENSVQNIILQGMESLDGIMIATTNMTSNLDKAFERRFLYKIRFEKPKVEIRSRIWMQMLKGLSREDAEILAIRFNLSGGEIENIVRKYSISAILSGSNIIDIRAVIKICEQERIQCDDRRHIGF